MKSSGNITVRVEHVVSSLQAVGEVPAPDRVLLSLPACGLAVASGPPPSRRYLFSTRPLKKSEGDFGVAFRGRRFPSTSSPSPADGPCGRRKFASTEIAAGENRLFQRSPTNWLS